MGEIREVIREEMLDYTKRELNNFPSISQLRVHLSGITHINISGNKIRSLPIEIRCFTNLATLDVSSNQLEYLPCEIFQLTKLDKLLLKNNFLQELPDVITSCQSLTSSLTTVNLSGNRFIQFPVELIQFPLLQHLHLGGNLINEIPKEIAELSCLEYLYLGGNKLTNIPGELGKLHSLKILNLCDNSLATIPKELAKLHQLETLNLHNNNLTVLPIAIVKLKNLAEITMRSNPLVIRFVRAQSTSLPSLQELTGKTIKSNNISYSIDTLPASLVKFLNSAKKCVNPNCCGVFFDSCVRHVKFVDFCGKYRLPFEQFLCSTHDNETWEDCVSSSSSTSDDEDTSWLKRILLG